VTSRPCKTFPSSRHDTDGSSAKGVRKNLISRGQDEATIKANRSEIDEIVRHFEYAGLMIDKRSIR